MNIIKKLNLSLLVSIFTILQVNAMQIDLVSKECHTVKINRKIAEEQSGLIRDMLEEADDELDDGEQIRILLNLDTETLRELRPVMVLSSLLDECDLRDDLIENSRRFDGYQKLCDLVEAANYLKCRKILDVLLDIYLEAIIDQDQVVSTEAWGAFKDFNRDIQPEIFARFLNVVARYTSPFQRKAMLNRTIGHVKDCVGYLIWTDQMERLGNAYGIQMPLISTLCEHIHNVIEKKYSGIAKRVGSSLLGWLPSPIAPEYDGDLKEYFNGLEEGFEKNIIRFEYYIKRGKNIDDFDVTLLSIDRLKEAFENPRETAGFSAVEIPVAYFRFVAAGLQGGEADRLVNLALYYSRYKLETLSGVQYFINNVCIRNCNITKFPEVLRNILHKYYKTGPSSHPEEVHNRIDLSGNRITTLPDWFKDWKKRHNVERINLADNPLNEQAGQILQDCQRWR